MKKKVTSSTRFRLSVYRSSKHIHAQIIDDKEGVTICSASSVRRQSQAFESSNQDGISGKIRFADKVGREIAKKAREKGVFEVFFDRNGYKYHGRVRQLAEAAREEGLNF